MKPIDKLTQDRSIKMQKTLSIIQQWVSDESVTEPKARQALQSKSGNLWDKAYNQALQEIDGEIANPIDAISLFSGPSLPLQWAYNAIQGKQNGYLPFTKLIKNATGALGLSSFTADVDS